MVQHMFEIISLDETRKLQMESLFLFKEGVSLYCHGPETSLILRFGHCLSHAPPRLKPRSCLWADGPLIVFPLRSYPLASPIVLHLTHSNTKISPQIHRPPRCRPVTSYCYSVALFHLLPNSLPVLIQLWKSHNVFQKIFCVCTTEKKEQRKRKMSRQIVQI